MTRAGQKDFEGSNSSSTEFDGLTGRAVGVSPDKKKYKKELREEHEK